MCGRNLPYSLSNFLLKLWGGEAITPLPPGSDGPSSYYYQKSCYTTGQIELLLYSIQRFTAGKFPFSSLNTSEEISFQSLTF